MRLIFMILFLPLMLIGNVIGCLSALIYVSATNGFLSTVEFMRSKK